MKRKGISQVGTALILGVSLMLTACGQKAASAGYIPSPHSKGTAGFGEIPAEEGHVSGGSQTEGEVITGEELTGGDPNVVVEDKELTAQGYITATYVGVEKSGSQPRAAVLKPGSTIYHFRVGEEVVSYSVYSEKTITDGYTEDTDGDGIEDYYAVYSAEEGGYPIQNILMPGYSYQILVQDGQVMDAHLMSGTLSNVSPAVPYKAGEKTVKNLLATGFAPMGTTLYVFGGGWDFQDMKSANSARTIGLTQSWRNFYNSQDVNYNFRQTYPSNAWNEYYYAGLDCSGYLSWVIYNTLYTESLSKRGFVISSTRMARNLAETFDFGSWEHISGGTESEAYYRQVISQLKPGDIVSVSGHIYMVLGSCSDGSLVIMHATVTNSSTGAEGGGVQLSAVSPVSDQDTACEAYKLVADYMSRYFPEWTAKYPPVVKAAADYLIFPDDKSATGIFRWHEGLNGISDPDGYRNMSAGEILADLFSE